MVNFRRHTSWASFLDVIFNLSLGLTLMFFLTFILMNPIAKTGDIELKAEFIVTLDWPEDINSDIDLWILDPGGRAVGYPQKESGPTALERDDLGNDTDMFTYDENGNSIRIEENHEIITVRAIVPGEWVVNVFYYQAKEPVHNGTGTGRGGHGGEPPEIPKEAPIIPVPVTVTLTQVNPQVKVISKVTRILNAQGEEKTMFRFYLDKTRKITMKGDDPIRFVIKHSNWNGYGP